MKNVFYVFNSISKIPFSAPGISFGFNDKKIEGNNETRDNTDSKSVLNIITYDENDR